MNYEIVNLHTGGQAQRWLLVYPDGRIMLRTAREAITSLGYGADPLSTPVTIEGIRKRAPHAAIEVEQALSRLRMASSSGMARPMKYEIISIYRTKNIDKYIVVTVDGEITLHTETAAGVTFEKVELADLRRISKRTARKAEASLRRLAGDHQCQL